MTRPAIDGPPVDATRSHGFLYLEPAVNFYRRYIGLMREHARVEGGFKPRPQRGAIISNATGLIVEAGDADSQLLHEPNSLNCDLTIDFPHLQRIRDSGWLK